jgi:hypothetical protein
MRRDDMPQAVVPSFPENLWLVGKVARRIFVCSI